ncbi:hypothetical protein AMJ47_01555 [Parcubacteria bacterium DG_72]|nr:MAG: hypothetical protein AMJ47_01555 [Parcubacteria bacterium DG_72]
MILKIDYRKVKLLIFVCLVLAILVIGYSPQSLAEAKTAEVKTSGEGLVSRVAPGEFLPISVKLINFGKGQRVDVTINYQILNSNNELVFSETETVAVETTASFVKNIQIPLDLPSGKYVASSEIIYEGQKVPASSNFQFTVERKIAGIFVSQLIVYGIITVLIGILFAVVSRLIIKKRRASRLSPHEYSNVPKQERLFYELISDIIMQMRYYSGHKAIEIAENIDGLVVQEGSGKVLKINKDPAEIIALLILQYQKQIGKKMRVLPRRTDRETKTRLRPIDKNLDIIKKYFR